MERRSCFYGGLEINFNHEVGRKCLLTTLQFKVWRYLVLTFWENMNTNYDRWFKGWEHSTRRSPKLLCSTSAPSVSSNSNEEENAPEETLADDFEEENKNSYEVFKKQEEELVRSIFDLFQQELL